MSNFFDLTGEYRNARYLSFQRSFLQAISGQYNSLYQKIIASTNLQEDISYISKGLLILFYEQKKALHADIAMSYSDDKRGKIEATEDLEEIDCRVLLHVYNGYINLKTKYADLLILADQTPQRSEPGIIIGKTIRVCIDGMDIENECRNTVSPSALNGLSCYYNNNSDQNKRYTKLLDGLISKWETPPPAGIVAEIKLVLAARMPSTLAQTA